MYLSFVGLIVSFTVSRRRFYHAFESINWLFGLVEQQNTKKVTINELVSFSQGTEFFLKTESDKLPL